MNITKTLLASLDGVYAVGAIQIEGRTHYVAATESRGRCLLFSPPDWSASVVWHGPGGCMDLAAVPGRDRAFLAIQEFLPIYQADNAEMIYAEAPARVTEPWHMTRVLDLPYVHRLGFVTVGGAPYLVASTLAQTKQSREDWSHPGAVYAGPLAMDPSGPWHLEPILTGIPKNHGLHVTQIDGDRVVLVAGAEGVFAGQVPTVQPYTWRWTRLIDHEVSDIAAADVDGDGVAEIVTIEPFHGDTIVVYKRQRGQWEAVFSLPMSFGHVVWGAISWASRRCC